VEAADRAANRAGTSAATVRSAATVVLVRDRPVREVPELEVFVLRRTPRAVFVPGATVFPGGAVDELDALALDRVTNLDDAAANAELGLTEGGLLRRIAAVRECFEESGILLARHAASGVPAPPDPEWRDAINAGQRTFAEMLETQDLVVDATDLHVFAHWLTPMGAPRRYDTWFFVARAPEGQDGVHDDAELVASEWIGPEDALARNERGEITFILPTLRSVQALGRFPSVAALFDALARVPRDGSGLPEVIAEASGERVVLPGDDVSRASHWTIPLPDITAHDEQRLLASGGIR
jgi:8-oxo-dGTP pyrophosphatase MutT (NUDIX family)